MTFDEYQQKSRATAKYPAKDGNFSHNLTYPVMGLASEAGEVAGKVKKVLRDNGGVIDAAWLGEIKGELGDVLWYVTQISTELGLSMKEVASSNLEKLLSRLERGKIAGSGDNR